VTATQVYKSLTSIRSLPDEIVRRGATPAVLPGHFARPPVLGLDFKMDARGVAQEFAI